MMGYWMYTNKKPKNNMLRWTLIYSFESVCLYLSYLFYNLIEVGGLL